METSKRIYFISGLGADSRAFRKLSFPSDFELIHLDWITPELNESLEIYAHRLALKIDTSTPFYLTWRNKEHPLNITHIHGTAGHILPIRYYKPDIVIAGGSHFMVYTNGIDISNYIIQRI